MYRVFCSKLWFVRRARHVCWWKSQERKVTMKINCTKVIFSVNNNFNNICNFYIVSQCRMISIVLRYHQHFSFANLFCRNDWNDDESKRVLKMLQTSVRHFWLFPFDNNWPCLFWTSQKTFYNNYCLFPYLLWVLIKSGSPPKDLVRIYFTLVICAWVLLPHMALSTPSISLWSNWEDSILHNAYTISRTVVYQRSLNH